ncbi:MAG: SRPBCC family protein, partial [Actinomycetota bacterium]|nr:SRPBCC family protein [Actinomycetota bacterium]
PLGVGRVHIRWSVAFAPEVWTALSADDRAQARARVLELIAAVNGEDRPVVEGVWRALHHRHAARGPFSHLERNVHDVDRYVAARVTGVVRD